MSDTEEDKQTGDREAGGDQGCPVEMDDLRRCGRPIYNAPPSIDKTPVCLMHSRDPNKDDAEFQAEFERILREAGEGVADFSLFVFPSSNYFARRFHAECVFAHATFESVADFTSATFQREVYFTRAKFNRNGAFCMAKFNGKAHFSHAVFSEVADFRFGTFEDGVEFMGTEFNNIAEFNERTFKRTVSFEWAYFGGVVRFRETIFGKNEESFLGPVFVEAHFDKPEQVVFYKTYLGRALFHNCGASKLVFRDVEWGKRTNGKSKVFEEEADLNSRVTKALKPEENSLDRVNYRLIGELYHELKKNYDEGKNYWTAGDFHYGEMEMKRRSSRRRNPVLRWLHRNLGLVAWYQYASDYGESYVKPFFRLLVVLALFTLAYPACRLHRTLTERPMPSKILTQAGSTTASSDEVSYAHFFQFLAGYPNRPWRGTASFFVQSFTTSVGVAALRRDFADYEPQSVLGRFAALIELLLTSTLVALFLLAVRRQFRR
jgi:hypothetical protein